LQFRGAGVNHMTWLTELKIDGKDVYPQLRGKLIESGYDKREPISFELFETFGLYPAPGDRHISEFYPYYLRKNFIAEKNIKFAKQEFDEYDGDKGPALAKLARLRAGEIGIDHFPLSGESASFFIRSLHSDEVCLEMANVLNRGYIENISDGILVEVPVFVDRFGLHPQKIGALPAFRHPAAPALTIHCRRCQVK